MKRILNALILAPLAFTLACDASLTTEAPASDKSSTDSKSESAATPKVDNSPLISSETKIYVDGMTWFSCSDDVQSALEGIEGIESASVSLREKLATIRVAPEKQVRQQQVIDALKLGSFKVNRFE